MLLFIMFILHAKIVSHGRIQGRGGGVSVHARPQIRGRKYFVFTSQSNEVGHKNKI